MALTNVSIDEHFEEMLCALVELLVQFFGNHRLAGLLTGVDPDRLLVKRQTQNLTIGFGECQETAVNSRKM